MPRAAVIPPTDSNSRHPWATIIPILLHTTSSRKFPTTEDIQEEDITLEGIIP
jgi:hypothetical protein